MFDRNKSLNIVLEELALKSEIQSKVCLKYSKAFKDTKEETIFIQMQEVHTEAANLIRGLKNELA